MMGDEKSFGGFVLFELKLRHRSKMGVRIKRFFAWSRFFWIKVVHRNHWSNKKVQVLACWHGDGVSLIVVFESLLVRLVLVLLVQHCRDAAFALVAIENHRLTRTRREEGQKTWRRNGNVLSCFLISLEGMVKKESQLDSIIFIVRHLFVPNVELAENLSAILGNLKIWSWKKIWDENMIFQNKKMKWMAE